VLLSLPVAPSRLLAQRLQRQSYRPIVILPLKQSYHPSIQPFACRSTSAPDLRSQASTFRVNIFEDVQQPKRLQRQNSPFTYGELPLRIPRDCKGEFEQIVALYARGMSTRDIQRHVQEFYGVELSAALISNLTDRLLPQIQDLIHLPVLISIHINLGIYLAFLNFSASRRDSHSPAKLL